MEIMSIISLVVLVAAIVIAFLLKVNTGVVAITAALIMGLFVDLGDKFLIGAFDSKLFLTLLGVMFLFGIAQENKTLEQVAKKSLALCRGRVNLFPPLLFLVSAVLSAMGPGLISVSALMSALTVTLARQTNTEPIRLIPFGVLGSFAGGLSPLTPSGIVAIEKAEAAGITGIEWPLMWQMALTNLLYAAILYFFVFKWHRYKHTPLDLQKSGTESEKFSAIQWMTLGGILLVAVLVMVLGNNVGLLSFAVGAVLLMFRAADDSAVFKKLPWGTLVMITGVGILISMVTKLGGIDLLSEGLKKLMNTHTASMIMSAISGVMSWVSSASGVVMPTLIPTVPDMVQSMQGVGSVELVISICVGAHLAALSPLSSCGGLMLAAYSTGDVTAKERNRVFVQLFAMSACGVAFSAILALLGLYG